MKTFTKNLTAIFAICFIAALLASCTKDDTGQPSTYNPPAPQPQPVSACQANHTATVTFKNNSSSRYTYNIILDGYKVATLSPQTISIPFTVASGNHMIQWNIAGTASWGCSESSVAVSDCSSYTFTCSY